MRSILNSALSALIIIGLASPALAQLPNRKKLIFLGTDHPNTTQHLWQYLDPNSLQKRGRFIYYTTWSFWAYRRGNTVATKSFWKGDCSNWETTMVRYQGVNSSGNIESDYTVNDSHAGEPDSLFDLALQRVCQ